MFYEELVLSQGKPRAFRPRAMTSPNSFADQSLSVMNSQARAISSWDFLLFHSPGSAPVEVVVVSVVVFWLSEVEEDMRSPAAVLVGAGAVNERLAPAAVVALEVSVVEELLGGMVAVVVEASPLRTDGGSCWERGGESSPGAEALRLLWGGVSGWVDMMVVVGLMLGGRGGELVRSIMEERLEVVDWLVLAFLEGGCEGEGGERGMVMVEVFVGIPGSLGKLSRE